MSSTPDAQDGGDRSSRKGRLAADEASHAELVRLSATGDEHAFAQLYDATAPVVYGVAVRLLRSPDLAAEVVQEVYLMAWQQSARFDPQRGSVKAWLCTMAHRRAVDSIRSVQRQRDRDEQYEGTRAESSEGDSTWGQVEEKLDNDDVRNGLTSLSRIQREAVCLVYFRGFSHREVAEHLKIPLGTAKSRIRDGLVGLRTALGEQW
ncbi:sigma-70 family RNA polymerase sigma factor [Rothia sp. AR01]|uniref:Sigma-70 family RNA polymerase sigma factor n=1 Tax=Rothia santali TaxID=2949643 RepID=A0A9X2HH14_9MICC|nr:sigma-70 family RNA polymerase sigma factor [Rothia santali]MCP3425566.1 sigma-70 family RNA polymerase sigma factor [Rothia santali]